MPKSFSPELFWADDYYNQLLTLIPSAQKQVIIVSMTLTVGPKTDKLFSLLEEAAKRGVKVVIVGDIYTKFAIRRSRLMRPKEKQVSWNITKNRLSQLQLIGAQVHMVGRLGINPFRHRMHCKFTVVDDTVFSFGGVNFLDSGFENNDYMFDIKSASLVKYFQSLSKDIAETSLFKDSSHKVDDNNTILLDGGQPGKSIIYEKACDLARNSKEIYLLSQMCPSGRLAKIMTETHYRAYFNQASSAPFPTSLSIFVDQKRSSIKNSYNKGLYLHAKCILFVGKDGQKSLISGSHNFSWRGVAYGTKEIALYSTDTRIWESLYGKFEKQIF